MTKDEALWMALGVLEFYYDLYKEKVDANVITAIKEALAQPEQEPVTLQINSIPPFKNPPNDVIDAAFHVSNWAQRNNWTKWRIGKCCSVDYTTPPRREWVGLTEEERDHFEGLHLYAARNQVEAWIEGVPAFIDAIESKLREKNGG